MQGLSMNRYPANSSLTEVRPRLRIIRAEAIVGRRMTLQGLRGFVGNPDPDERGIHEFRRSLGNLSEHIVDVERGRNKPVQARQRLQASGAHFQTFVELGVRNGDGRMV